MTNNLSNSGSNKRKNISHYFSVLIPLKKGEIVKCLSMGIMFFCILLNYDILRALKDGLIVANIGPEAVPFVKTYVITPAAIGLMLFYTYIADKMKFEYIFYLFTFAFLLFFLSFGFLLFPNQDYYHPSVQKIQELSQSGLFGFSLIRFKWFFLLYSKWLFVCFYVIAELWGSAMIFLLFWQFANKVTLTEDAKRLYPFYAFLGNSGNILLATGNVSSLNGSERFCCIPKYNCIRQWYVLYLNFRHV